MKKVLLLAYMLLFAGALFYLLFVANTAFMP